jgi:hypothetical protein
MQFDHDSSYVTFMQVLSVIHSWMAKQPSIVWLVCCLIVVSGCNGPVLFDSGKKVQHGAEAFTDIISLIIALSPE